MVIKSKSSEFETKITISDCTEEEFLIKYNEVLNQYPYQAYGTTYKKINNDYIITYFKNSD